MKLQNRHLIIGAVIVATAVVITLAITHPTTFLWISSGILVLGIAAFLIRQSLCNRRFNIERSNAMNAVEDLEKTLDFIDKELPLPRYERFQFSLAVNHALAYTDCLRRRIYALQGYFECRCMPKDGLLLKDMPASLHRVGEEVKAAYAHIKNGSRGTSPPILQLDWFDEATILSGKPRQARKIAQLKAVSTVSHQPVRQEITMDQVVTQPSAAAPAVSLEPALVVPAQRLLTYAPSDEHHVACSATDFDARRRAQPAHNRDVVRHEVVYVDFKLRKKAGQTAG